MIDLQNNKQFLDNYIFKPDKPTFSTPTYQVHTATQKQTNLPVTIKFIKDYSPELLRYLRKLKDCKSQNTIRVYQLQEIGKFLMLITQYNSFGNLSNALSKCDRLQQNDAISVSKMLLNGYVDLLTRDCTWVGTQNDIQFTDSGIKLSWNNYSCLQAQNCITKIIQRLSFRKQNRKTILPFPKNKIIQELVKVSRQNASQISLNQNMKKKQKLIKKKGDNWLPIKQISLKNQYMDQNVYLAVSKYYGFVRVKIYDKGKINQQLLSCNKTKANFTRVLDYFDQQNKTIIISEYSNDGNLQLYITKLKNNNIRLTEEDIEFFFYSLFEPLKQVQQSTLKSIGMLHIKNIYLENGVPKIGEPIPMNQNLYQSLRKRSDVPDFYHPQFKKQPNSKSQLYDTYSLGILLYKLMYTQYPIFPEAKVHIPTAPSYNKQVKNTLQILLNEGGNLRNLQAKIQVSENVKNQVKQDKAILNIKNNKMPRNASTQTKKTYVQDIEETVAPIQQKSQQQSQQQVVQDLGCCSLCCHALELQDNQQAKNKFTRVASLQQSPYKIYRVCTKLIIVLLFYIFVFYYFFLQTNFSLFSNQSKISTYKTRIATVNYTIITTNNQTFETQYNKTSKTVSALKNLNCFIDSYNEGPIYSDFFINTSSGWIFYISSSFLCFIIFMLLKGWQTYNFDIIKAIYNWDHALYGFNISNYIVFNLLFCCLLYGHYYLFNFIFTGQFTPCLGAQYVYDTTNLLFNSIKQFQFPYMTTFILQILITLVQGIMIWRTHQISYNKLINPIILICPFLIVQWIIIRIGVINDYFKPNGLQNNEVIKNYFINGSYINFLGTIPQILWIGQLLLGAVVDVIYWCFLDKRRRLLILQTSATTSLQQLVK